MQSDHKKEGVTPFWKRPKIWAWTGAGLLTAWIFMPKAKPQLVSHGPPPMTIIPDRPVPVAPGKTYYGTATVNFPASLVVSASAIVKKLTSMGFTDIVVATTPPADWPASEQTGDYFVKATYSGGPTTIKVPTQVTAVWT